MSHHLSPAKFMMIATAMLSTPVVGQEPLLNTPLASKTDSVSNNDATKEWDTREVSTEIPLRHVQANWVVMNIQQLFKKQKEEFSIIGDDRQVVVRGNKRIIDEILNIVESLDRPPKSIEEPRNEPKRNALPAGIAEEVVAELKDSRRQAIIDQLSKSENLNDQDKRNLKLEEEGLDSDKAAFGRILNNWKRIWSEYRTQLELLQLDIKDVETILSSLEKKAVQTMRQVSQGSLSQQELDEQLTRIELARTKIDRAKKIFDLYAEIEKSDPELNPSKLEQAAPHEVP